jgi:hypothetical protein
VTLGERGASSIARGSSSNHRLLPFRAAVVIPPEPAMPFAAAFFTVCCGEEIETSMRFANAVAALKCRFLALVARCRSNRN